MTLKIQLIISIIVLLGLIYIVRLIRKNRIDLKYALPWLVIGVVVIIFTWIPDSMELLAEFIGIASPINMIFFLGFLFSLVIILALTIAVSSAAGGVKRLVQKQAILEKRNRELEEKVRQMEEHMQKGELI